MQIRVPGNFSKNVERMDKKLKCWVWWQLVVLDFYLNKIKLVSSGILPPITYCMQTVNFNHFPFFFKQKEEELLCMENDTFKYQTHCLGIFYDDIRNWNAKFCLQFLLCEAFFTSVQDFRSGLLPSPGEMGPHYPIT